MFCDEVKVLLSSGKGGDGLVSWRKKKFLAMGGPNGGDGGKGGDVFLVADKKINTLYDFQRKKVWSAENGENGKKSNMHGKNGKSLFLSVPVGTMVFFDGEKVADLMENEDKVKILCGGKGGFGNAHFTTSVRRSPSFAELGEKEETKKFSMKLKLIADIAIIGLPSSGKSTLISSVSNCKAKIAEYHFTTLIPNLGIVKIADENLVFADIPGLIKNAYKGKGLGVKFLKHTQRARILIHLIDILSENPLEDFNIINENLQRFSGNLAKKKQVIAVNKIDVLDEKTFLKKFDKIKNEFLKNGIKNQIFAISAVSKKNIKQLLDFVANENKKEKIKELSEKQEEIKVFQPHLENSDSFWIDNENEKWRVFGARIEQVANMTNGENAEAMQRLDRITVKMGIKKELIKMGLKEGEIFFITDKSLIL